jgi:hypothetical protein
MCYAQQTCTEDQWCNQSQTQHSIESSSVLLQLVSLAWHRTQEFVKMVDVVTEETRTGQVARHCIVFCGTIVCLPFGLIALVRSMR